MMHSFSPLFGVRGPGGNVGGFVQECAGEWVGTRVRGTMNFASRQLATRKTFIWWGDKPALDTRKHCDLNLRERADAPLVLLGHSIGCMSNEQQRLPTLRV